MAVEGSRGLGSVLSTKIVLPSIGKKRGQSKYLFMGKCSELMILLGSWTALVFLAQEDIFFRCVFLITRK